MLDLGEQVGPPLFALPHGCHERRQRAPGGDRVHEVSELLLQLLGLAQARGTALGIRIRGRRVELRRALHDRIDHVRREHLFAQHGDDGHVDVAQLGREPIATALAPHERRIA